MGKIIHISVRDKVALYSARDGAIICGNDDYQVQFALDPEWDGVPAKARFIWNGQYEDALIVDGIAKVPRIIRAHEVRVGVYSEDESLQTTTAARVPCSRSILCDTAEPTEDNEAFYASKAQEAADRAEAAADRAEAAGGNGGAGGGVVIDPESVNQAQEAAQAAQESAEAAADSAQAAGRSAEEAETSKNQATAAKEAAEAAQRAAEAAESGAAQKATDAKDAAQTAASKATEATEAKEAAETAQTTAEAAAARAEEAANRLLGVAVVGVIETVNGAPSLVLTGVQEVADYTAYYKVVDEEGNETLVEIGQLVPKDETEPDPVTYKITWVNYDDTVLEIDEKVPEGVTPTYDGATPTRAADDQYTYTFKGWDKTVVAATADATYTATYTQTAKPAAPTYTNLADPSSEDWKPGYRLDGSGALKEDSTVTGLVTTNFVSCVSGDEIRIKGMTLGGSGHRVAVYTSNKACYLAAVPTFPMDDTTWSIVNEGNGVYKFIINASSVANIRFSGVLTGTSADVIVTKNKPIS